MSWTPGANVYVAIAEQDELAKGKVLHENKSGTVRVQLNDGSKITVGAEEVFENPNKTPKSRQRSRSPARKSTGGRGRSPGRTTKSPARTASAGRKRSTSRGRKPNTTPKTKNEKPEKASTTKKSVEKKKEEPVTSPSMTLRVRRWNKDEAIDSDGDETKSKKKGKDATDGPSKVATEFGGACGVTLMVLSVLTITVGAHMMLRSGSFNLRGQDWRKLVGQWPKWEWQSVGLLVGFWVLQVLLSLLPIGPIEKALPGSSGPRQYRRNGLISAVVTIAIVLGLGRYGYALTKAQLWAYMPQWAACSVVAGLLLGAFCAWKASRLPISQQNPAVVATGRYYSFWMGKQINPVVGNLHLKMVVFKIALTESLVLSLLAYLNLEPTGYTACAALALPCIYTLDFLVFEQHFLTSFEVQSEGYGAFLSMGMLLYPFCEIIMPLYVISAKVDMRTWCVASICLLFIIGLLINRLSNNQKFRFRKNPMDPAVSHLETLPTARGKKLLVSGWWGLVRHPNYLGDIFMHLSFGLISGFGHVLPWYLPAVTIIMLVHRVSRDNRRCQAKYGDAWSRYCDKVKHRVLPKIY